MLWAVWVSLSGCFLGALLALRLPQLQPSPALSPATLFQDLLRYGKTKSGCGKRHASLSRCDLPKRWFYHFYIVSVIWNGFLLLLLTQSLLISSPFPPWLQDLLSVLDQDPQDDDKGVKSMSAFLVCLFVCLHSCRRLWECLCISVFSKGVIHIVQYCFGLCYYILVGVTVICQVPANIRKGVNQLLTVSWYHVLGLLMFIWASLHQHKSHVILANLRKNNSGISPYMEIYGGNIPIHKTDWGEEVMVRNKMKGEGKVVNLDHCIPFGDWFEVVSCPHYFAELLIYLSMAITFGFKNLTWWVVVMYVLLNQAVSAVLCHEFYQRNFKNYPKHRKAYLPFLF